LRAVDLNTRESLQQALAIREMLSSRTQRRRKIVARQVRLACGYSDRRRCAPVTRREPRKLQL